MALTRLEPPWHTWRVVWAWLRGGGAVGSWGGGVRDRARDRSGEDVSHHPAVDVGQAEVSTGVAVGELLVVEAQEVEDGGVEVVDVDALFGRVHAQLVG